MISFVLTYLQYRKLRYISEALWTVPGNLWIALKVNFGGKPSSFESGNPYCVLMFSCLLTGSVIWMAYRASLTSKLSIEKKFVPFKDPHGVLKTTYRMIGPSRNTEKAKEIFFDSPPDSLYGKLLRNNMDDSQFMYVLVCW